MDKVPFDSDNLSLHQSNFPLSSSCTTEQTSQNIQNLKNKLKHSLTINSINSIYGCENRLPNIRSVSLINKKSDNSLFLEMVKKKKFVFYFFTFKNNLINKKKKQANFR